MREHLESYERQTGRVHPMLAEAPGLPEGLVPLWNDFMALHEARGSAGFGPARLSYADIDAYQRVNGTRFVPWQIAALRRADSAYMTHYAETHKPKGGM